MTDDWRDLLSALLETEARFLVVGAHAMAVHGVPRGTQDLDVWIDPQRDNVDRVWSALAAFGAPLGSLDLTPDDLRRPGTVIQFGLPPNRIDLLTAISGVIDFDAAWSDRVEHEVQGVGSLRSAPGARGQTGAKRASVASAVTLALVRVRWLTGSGHGLTAPDST